MSSSILTLYPFNLLGEPATIVSAPADLEYPVSRLYDRSIDFYWRKSASSAFVISVDQGSAGVNYVDFLAVARHNFVGATVDWQYSSNASSWTNAVPQWTPANNDSFYKTLTTPILRRYWRLSVGAVSSPSATEVYMSLAYPFRIIWNETPSGTDLDNVDWFTSVGGFERSVKNGESKRRRQYPLFHHSSTSTLASFRQAMLYTDSYSKPFYIKDHEDQYWLAKLTDMSEERYASEGITFRQVSLTELL